MVSLYCLYEVAKIFLVFRANTSSRVLDLKKKKKKKLNVGQMQLTDSYRHYIV
jgi:hypothetical protein